MTDHDFIVSLKTQIDAHLGAAPPIIVTPPPIETPPPVEPPPAERCANFSKLDRPLWERGSRWEIGFSFPGETHTESYTVPEGASYPIGQVQLMADPAFYAGDIRVFIDGEYIEPSVPVIPVGIGQHIITTVCQTNPHTQAHGSGPTGINIVNQ